MPIVPLFGHDALRARMLAAMGAGRLPASLLIRGPAGIGKQRLALWLAGALLCEAPGPPCGKCQSCRYVAEVTHPDLHWVFPRPRLKDSDPPVDDVRQDYAEAIADRVRSGGLYSRPSGSEGIFVATVRAVIQRAAISPGLGRRKVFIVGDAERMVPQEGADMAANAFLKLLEEPPADTTIILTSSEPGALLPTIGSRVVALRAALLPDTEVAAFVADPVARKALQDESLPPSDGERVVVAAGAPGTLIGGGDRAAARDEAKRFLAVAAAGDRAAALKLAFSQGTTRARGRYTDTLEALATMLHARVRESLERGDGRGATASVRGVEAVERAKELAAGNVSPNLVSVRLFHDLGQLRR